MSYSYILLITLIGFVTHISSAPKKVSCNQVPSSFNKVPSSFFDRLLEIARKKCKERQAERQAQEKESRARAEYMKKLLIVYRHSHLDILDI